MQLLPVILSALSGVLGLISVVLLAVLLVKMPQITALQRMQQVLSSELRAARGETVYAAQQAIAAANQSQCAALEQGANQQDRRLAALQATLGDRLRLVEGRLDTTGRQNEQKLENIRQSVDARLASLQQENARVLGEMRQTVENRLTALQQENTRCLDEMRRTVDEKLQKTLEERLKRSFETVSTQLEQVYKGLGEMQNLASGVGDLKKVLSNVKTRGILGEIQLGSILEEILPREQYECNVVTRPDRRDPVEFAIRLPGDGNRPVLLPVDAKFPLDCYARLVDAYDSADSPVIEQAGRELEQRIRTSAKDIHDKYVEPPYTTDFAILFLPTEGLYAEVVRRGMVERLQREYKINVAGPSTMAALLNSLQMGFQTLAIQKRSGEVWQVLSGVRTEFDTFAEALTRAQGRIRQADTELENLLGVRTRQMQRKLKAIQLPETSAEKLPSVFSVGDAIGDSSPQPDEAVLDEMKSELVDGDRF